MEEEVDEVSLRKAIPKKYPPLNTSTCRTVHCRVQWQWWEKNVKRK